MPNWIIYFFAVPNEINSVAPEWVDLAKNVNQGSGSQVITLRSDWGGGEGEGAGSSRVPCCQHQDCFFIQTTNQLIPEFLYSLCFCATLDLFGFGGEDPSLQMSGYGLCDPPSKPEMIGPEVLTQKQ